MAGDKSNEHTRTSGSRVAVRNDDMSSGGNAIVPAASMARWWENESALVPPNDIVTVSPLILGAERGDDAERETRHRDGGAAAVKKYHLKCGINVAVW